MQYGEKQVGITGIGKSPVGRHINRSGLSLTSEACLQAIADAGLTPADIDGVSTFPGERPTVLGASPIGVGGALEALRIVPQWFSGGNEQPSQLGAIFNAISALAAGYCKHVHVFRTVWEASDRTPHNRAKSVTADGERVWGLPQWQTPFQSYSASNWIAFYATRYQHLYGLTSEQLAQVSMACRYHATLNPEAVLREPMSLEDHQASRMISSPFRMFDCDLPVDGSIAVVISRLDATEGLRNEPILVEAVGAAQDGRYSWDQYHDLSSMPATGAAKMMWGRTDLTTADVDVAELYDGFSFLPIAWIEAFGFAGKGEGQSFVENDRIRLGGELPINTDGGQLSAGRLHGYGYVHEACTQLWGRGDRRQVTDAKVAVCGVGGGPWAGSLLLRKD
jgi:acetyl-CoA acetyltransferase